MKQTLLFTFILSFAVVLPSHRTAFADNKDEAKLRNQVKDLQQDITRMKRELNEREQAIKNLRAALQKENIDDVKDQVSVKMLKDKDAIIARLQADANEYRGTRAVYTAYYKRKQDTPASAVDALITDANATLSKVRGIRGLWVGRAAGDSDFHVALVAIFDDGADLKQFREDTMVQRFETKHSKEWEQTVREFARAK